MRKPLLILFLLVAAASSHGQTTKTGAITPKIFEWKTPRIVGSYKGMNIRIGGLSALDFIQGSKMDFWTLTDRGANAGAEKLKEGAIIFPFADFSPAMLRIRLEGDSLRVLEEVPLKRPDGSPATGTPPPVGFGGTGEIGWADETGKPVPTDIWGTDCESIAQGIAGNDIWIGEEYGTSIWHVEKKSGRVIERYTPVPNTPQDKPIDTIFKMREPNKGFECMTITPSGKIIAIVQEPLLNPNKESGKKSRIHRIVKLDPKTGKTQMFAYVHEATFGDIKNTWKVGDMTAVNENEFLVIEHSAKKGDNVKRIWKINLKGATQITKELVNGKTIEQLGDSAGLATNGIHPVKKTLFFDLLANGWDPKLDKPEGITIINPTTIAVLNDNDFGIKSKEEDGNITMSGIPSRVYVWELPKSMKLDFTPRKIAH